MGSPNSKGRALMGEISPRPNTLAYGRSRPIPARDHSHYIAGIQSLLIHPVCASEKEFIEASEEILFTDPSLEIDKSLPLFIRALGTVREAVLILEKGRIYGRRTDIGYLVVLLGLLASGAMLRLHVDMVLPPLKDEEKGRA
jgi:hypothetical protein